MKKYKITEEILYEISKTKYKELKKTKMFEVFKEFLKILEDTGCNNINYIQDDIIPEGYILIHYNPKK